MAPTACPAPRAHGPLLRIFSQELERVVEARRHFVCGSALVVVRIHVDRTGPVFRGGDLDKKLLAPRLDFYFVDRSIKHLDLDRVITFIDRNNFKQRPIRAAKPLTNCRKGGTHLCVPSLLLRCKHRSYL